MSADGIRPPSLLALPSYLASHLAQIGRRGLADALAERGLRLPHFAVLTGLADFGPLAQHDLADRLGLNRSHLVGYLDEVESRGYVARERDPGDRRRQRVALTEDGRTVADELLWLAQESQQEFLGVLTEAERETLIGLMRRVVNADDAAHRHVIA
jgi:DNA-binding MarR family transcriptional regulator